MGRSPCCDADAGLKKGPWLPEEDQILTDYITKNGCGNWRNLPKLAGLNRCGKSCRLRWTNYLRPDIKRGSFSDEEDRLIIDLHSKLGNKWSAMAARLPGRTDNEIKNYWNTHLRKKLLSMGIDPVTHRPKIDLNPLAGLSHVVDSMNLGSLVTSPLIANALQLQKLQLLQTLIQVVGLQDISSLMAYNNNVASLPVNGVSVENNSVSSTPANSVPSMAVDEEPSSQVNCSESSSPANSTPAEGWGGLTMDDLDRDDFGWKDILE